MLVFVYGTLRQGESNHHLMVGAKLIGRVSTPPGFELYNLGPYPAAIRGEGIVQGEVYAIDHEILKQLDRLEDHPNWYRRELIETPFGRAWFYVYLDSLAGYPKIPSGDWLDI